MLNILVLGSGGREHTLAWKLVQSPLAKKVYVAPGNAGTGFDCTNVEINPNDFKEVKRFVLEADIQLVLVGPEDPLANGIVDFFETDPLLQHVHIFGPKQQAAQLESSKDFAKEFMMRHDVPTAAYRSFTAETKAEAEEFIRTSKRPYVLKADGLAAGKGVLILDDQQEAINALNEMFSGKFGAAGNTVVIEEFLSGIELSVFVITDGKDYLLLPEAKDYKRIGEGDTGLNTGGMGSISPVPFADEAFMKKVRERIINPTVEGLSRDGIPYLGFIFFGLINVAGDPYVIEYNVRMGDPETESVIPRVQSDLTEIIYKSCLGKLSECRIGISDQTAASVMLVSGGYPEAYEKGMKMEIPSDLDGLVFHAGTKYDEESKSVFTSGGRVIALTALGNDLPSALKSAYEMAEKVQFQKKYFRADLGKDLL